MTDHYLLMTATPHKGDPENFCLFLELLDRDVYGDVKSLEEAMKKHEAPFYLRRVKEALVSFPDPDTGKVKSLFTKRNVQTTEFKITELDEAADFYDALTRYVEDQSIKAASEDSARGRALGFTMAMLQRRFASSIYAVRRSLERMKDKRGKILADPEGYRQEQINKRLPDDFDDLPEEEQQEIIAELEDLVASYDPATLREEIVELGKLIDQARRLEKREVESKLVKLRELLTEHGIFKDPKMKLLIFTEHKDTLDFLAGDGKDGRPLGKLREWGLSVTQIHGGMKIGDRDTPGTRIYAEREFRESAQVLVATEAAGEGINLQFCWFMINYDIPWNPVRLEQRMGRIHRYGQEKDCLIFNFVSTNTREGRVLHKLFERIQAIEDDLDPKRTGKVFNVLGDVFPANQSGEDDSRHVRPQPDDRGTHQAAHRRAGGHQPVRAASPIPPWKVSPKSELNLSAIIGKSAEAKERRLVPEVIEDFFIQAAPTSGIQMRRAGPDGSPRPSDGRGLGVRARGVERAGVRGILPSFPAPTSTASAGSPASSGPSASASNPASASSATSTKTLFSTSNSCPRTQPLNGSLPATLCSRPSARTCWKTPPLTSSGAASSTTCTPARRTASISSRHRSKMAATTRSTAACSPSRPTLNPPPSAVLLRRTGQPTTRQVRPSTLNPQPSTSQSNSPPSSSTWRSLPSRRTRRPAMRCPTARRRSSS